MALKVKVGDSIKWTISKKQEGGVTPVNLTGFTIKVKATDDVSRSKVAFDLTSGLGTAGSWVTITDAAGGVFELVVKDTSAIRAGTYTVDIKYVDASGFVSSDKGFQLVMVDRL